MDSRPPGSQDPTTQGDFHFCISASKTLRFLSAQLERPSNYFINIKMGKATLLGILSLETSGHFNNIHSGTGSIQYIHGYHPKTEDSNSFIQEVTGDFLQECVSRFPRGRYKLERRRTNIFREILLREGERMLILSCTVPIIVDSVKGEERSVLITGQVSRETITCRLH
jgi:hypothetical protein